MAPPFNKNRSYEFNGYLFYPEKKLVEKIESNQKSWLYPKDAELLEFFLTSSSEISSNRDIASRVWQTDNPKSVIKNIRQSVHKLRQVLGDDLIKTVFGEGYQFDGKILKRNLPAPVEYAAPISRPGYFSGYSYFVVATSLLYSMVCVLSLFLEIGYKFEEFKNKAYFISFPVFAAAFALTLGCFWLVNYFAIRHSSARGLIFGVISLGATTSLVTILGCQILPDYPITETVSPQSQTAQTAYLKDLCFYLLPIFSVSVLIPFGSILLWKKEIDGGRHKAVLRIMRNRSSKAIIGGGVNFPVSVLLILLLALFLYSTFTTLSLSDNLSASPHRNLFSLLLWGRNALYFIIAITGIWWYSENRKEITTACLEFVRR